MRFLSPNFGNPKEEQTIKNTGSLKQLKKAYPKYRKALFLFIFWLMNRPESD